MNDSTTFSTRKGATPTQTWLPFSLLLAAGAVAPIQANETIAIQPSAEAEYRFRIPPQDLTSALNAFAETAQVQISFPSELAAGKTSPGVEGRYEPEQALEKLIKGSGLTYRITPNGSITLQPVQTQSLTTDRLLAASPMEKFMYAAAEPEEEPYTGPVEQVEMTVRGGDWSGYTVLDATTATKTDTPIMDTPLSIEVVPQQVLKDQQVILLKDALKNVSGVNWVGDHVYDGFQIRGFVSDGFTTVYRNGLRIRRAPNEVANLEQIEVLKGPAAALYGRVEPGGLINLDTKKPLDTPYYALEQQFGSYDFYRTTIDATGPIDEDHSLLYRLNIAYRNNGTFIDQVDQERVFIAPSLTWRPGERTEVNLNLEYMHDDRQWYGGLPVSGQRPANIPISTYLGYGGDQSFSVMDKVLVGFDWSHEFNDNWKLQQRFHYYNLDYEFNNTWFMPNPVSPVDGHSVARGLSNFPFDDTDTYATSIDLTGKFDIFGTQHEVLVGFDYFLEENQRQGFLSNPAPAAFHPVIDIFNPVYPPIPQITAADFNRFNTLEQYWYGVYFQDQITLFDKLHIMGGGRYDWTTRRAGSSRTSLGSALANETEVKDEAFSPRVGIVYRPWSWLSLYGNYVESLGAANTASSVSGQPLNAETAQQHEVGFKTELFDHRLLSTVAFYEITKQNVATADLLNPGFSIATGEVRSRGIEVDVSGQVTDGLSLIASYAYIDSEITKDNRGNEGHKFFNIPEHSGSFWAKYSVQDAALRGLNFGAGAYIVGKRQGNNANSWQLPGYVRIDGFVSYTMKVGASRVTAQLNVNNLLDKRIYESSALGVFSAMPGAPRNFMGAIRVEF